MEKRARKKAMYAINKLTTDLTLAHGRGDYLLPSSLYVAHYTIRLSRPVMCIIDFWLRNLKILFSGGILMKKYVVWVLLVLLLSVLCDVSFALKQCQTCFGTGKYSFCGGDGKIYAPGGYTNCYVCHGSGRCGVCGGRGYTDDGGIENPGGENPSSENPSGELSITFAKFPETLMIGKEYPELLTRGGLYLIMVSREWNST